jgi:hypothetical protein
MIDQLLLSKNIDPSLNILTISSEEALVSIVEALEEFEIEFDFNKFSKEELEKLLSDYAGSVLNYHPEDYHQERAALIKNSDILLKYGLTKDDIEILDFA